VRYGFKIIDSDTHFQAAAESILPYLKGTAIESRIPEFEQAMVPIRTGRAAKAERAIPAQSSLGWRRRGWWRLGR
jgi:hypothetical protein